MTAAEQVSLLALRCKIAGIDTDGMDAPQMESALAARDARRYATPDWLFEPRATYPDPASGVAQTADRIVTVARDAEDGTSMGRALYDVLVNAASHRPEFEQRRDDTAGEEPWGCGVCGCADGVGACDTWTSGVALAHVLAAETASGPS